jgi:hypothetical protein
MLLAALAAACSWPSADDLPPVPEEADGPYRLVSDEWQRVDGVPGRISDVDATYTQYLAVTGRTDDGAAMLAAVDGATVLRVASDIPRGYGDGASSATGDYENEGFVLQTDPEAMRPARIVVGQLNAGWDVPEAWHPDVLRDRSGRPASWASLLFDDEGDLRAVGAVRQDDGRWRAHLWEAHPDDGRWRVEERGDGPLLAQPPDAATLVTSTEEVQVWLAETTGEGARVWSIPGDPYDPYPWQRRRLDGGADTVTDILSWAIGSWVAGSRDGRAVIWDFDDGAGEVDIPDIPLDAEDPSVRLLRLSVSTQPAFAVQAPDGPSVWLKGVGAWRELKAPAGTMTLAAATDRGFYLVIDGALWFRPMPWDEQFP